MTFTVKAAKDVWDDGYVQNFLRIPAPWIFNVEVYFFFALQTKRYPVVGILWHHWSSAIPELLEHFELRCPIISFANGMFSFEVTTLAHTVPSVVVIKKNSTRACISILQKGLSPWSTRSWTYGWVLRGQQNRLFAYACVQTSVESHHMISFSAPPCRKNLR